MKNKIILLVILLFTGCTAEYNVYINDNFEEKIKLDNVPNLFYKNYNESYFLAFSSDIKEITDYFSKEDYEKFELYNVKDLSKNNLNILEYSYNFNNENYNDSRAINTCYDSVKIFNEENKVTISTTSNFKCFEYYNELETVKINIRTDYKVVQTNSDKKNGKTYTWEINKKNAKNKPIIFVYDKSEKVFSIFDYFENTIITTIFVSSFILIVGIVVLIIRKRSKSINKI